MRQLYVTCWDECLGLTEWPWKYWESLSEDTQALNLNVISIMEQGILDIDEG